VLAAELAALRNVAALIARGTPAVVVLESVARHVASSVEADFLEILQFEGRDRPMVVAAWAARRDRMVDLDRWPLADDALAQKIDAARLAVREDRSDPLQDTASAIARQRHGVRSSVGVPVPFRDEVWGAIFVHSVGPAPLPPETERLLSDFTELVTSAVANSTAQAAVTELAADQAALLRVAELVAREAPPDEVFAAVAEELGKLLGVPGAELRRSEASGTSTFLASWGPLEAGLPTVEAPIIVDGQEWGALVVGSVRDPPLPPDTEQRMAKFADLVAIALANLESREALRALADEQAALRRVATAVARGEWPDTSATIVREVALLLGAQGAVMLRYEPDETITVLATWGSPDMTAYVDQRLPFQGDNTAAEVWRTHRPARQEDFDYAVGGLAELSRREGITCAVASPVIVENQLWGAIVVVTSGPERLPADTEARIGQFTELLATAIGNLKSRSDLLASRTRIVQTADQTRRRFERDLHDGIQQRLVSIALDLHAVEQSLPAGSELSRARLAGVAEQLSDTLEHLRELSRGLHPAILSEGGLAPAVRALARRSPVPAQLQMDALPRMADPVEVAAYSVVSEALANAGKHAGAARVDIALRCRDGHLEVTVTDDGHGGADPARGSGLTGLVDRAEVLGGSVSVHSPNGHGTRLVAILPLSAP